MPLSNSRLTLLFIYFGVSLILEGASVYGQAANSNSPTYAKAIDLYHRGHYEEAAEQARRAREKTSWDDVWWVLEAKALTRLGRYIEANENLEQALERRPYSIRLLLMAWKAALYAGKTETAEDHRFHLQRILSGRYRGNRDPDSIVALGEAAILFGLEPRLALENFFKRAQETEDPPPSAFLAAGQLALDKNDSALAAKQFQAGLSRFPDDPDLWRGLAQSFMNSDRSQMASAADRALSLNDRHGPTLILLAEHLIDAEAYEKAQEQLDLAIAVNPYDPDALALKASLAYIDNDDETGDEYRNRALSTWSSNPKIDHRIGKALSRKYRFEEAAAAQRRALTYDPSYAHAQVQLAEDLLRLGRENEGWALINEAHDQDPYNVTAYNLVSLHDKLDEFVTLSSPHFRVRMSAEESEIYGPRAIALLESAYEQLSPRYDIRIDFPVTVEIYPNPADFQVRTFGTPGHGGFLGVCFGPLFTINSPSSKQANWESVLWHEFCHSITLTKTKNRMPRWLSEGISVYEEMIANPAWGQRMTIDYQNRIISGNMNKVSEMSAAFLEAQGGEDIQFAYYQSYLAVRYLFETHGIQKMNALLDTLAEGASMNESFESILGSLRDLDESFAQYAVSEAKKLGGSYETIIPEGMLAGINNLLKSNPSYTDALDAALESITTENWTDARDQLEELTSKTGYIPGDANAHIHLARVYRELEETERERDALLEIARREGSRLQVVKRLLDLSENAEDPSDIKKWSDAWIAISPMSSRPWKSLFTAEKARENRTAAIAAAKAFIHLEPAQGSPMRYELAKLYQESDPAEAKRQVLMALEDAPRYRLAYELLQELATKTNQSEANVTPLIDTSFDI